MSENTESLAPPGKGKPFKLSLVGILILIVVGIVAIPVMVILNLRMILAKLGLCSKRATVGDLKFPVVLARADHASPVVQWDIDGLRKIRDGSDAGPSEGATIIDADLKMYTERNVRAKRRGDISVILGILFPFKPAVVYSFDLKRCKKSGLEAARERLALCAFEVDGLTPAAAREEIIRQTTLEGMIAVLERGKRTIGAR